MNNPNQFLLLVPNSDIEEELDDNQPKGFPNVRLGDDVLIWKGSIVYQVLYLMLEVEAIVKFMARFLMRVAIFNEVPSKRYKIRHGCGV